MSPTTPVSYLPFELELAKLDDRLRKLEELSSQNAMDFAEEMASLRKQREEFLRTKYSNLSAWERIMVARHQQRPQTLDYIPRICEDFLELHGDRLYGDDRAIVSGLATIGPHRVMLMGQHKGRDLKERQICNFGSPQPEGYRKALWKMRLAEKYKLPIVTLIDTKGAAPDVGAEERGQSQAIAYNLMVMAGLRVPILCIDIGEGGSGGALGIGVGDRLLMLEFAYFSVISPEGCASILWKDANKREEAAEALKMTAPQLKALGVVDDIITEPLGGAHRDPVKAAALLKAAIVSQLTELKALTVEKLLDGRYAKLRAIGKFSEGVAESVAAS